MDTFYEMIYVQEESDIKITPKQTKGKESKTMITYEKALEIARERKDEIDNCTEYENAYVFGFSGDNNYVGGYGHTPVVIMKEDGRLTTILESVGKLGQEIETHEVPQDIQLTYVEPIEYMPEELRKEFKLGEYAEDDE